MPVFCVVMYAHSGGVNPNMDRKTMIEMGSENVTGRIFSGFSFVKPDVACLSAS